MERRKCPFRPGSRRLAEFKTELEKAQYEHRVNIQRIRNKERWMKLAIIAIPILVTLSTVVISQWMK